MSCKHWYEIDNLYTIGIFLVILGHSHSSDWNSFAGTPLETMTDCFLPFLMPLFFLIAGFLFDNSTVLQQNNYGSWLKKKTIHLMTPYIILSVVALAPKYYFEMHSWAGIGMYAVRAILIPRESVWGHFWFLPVLLLVYVIFGIWKKMTREANQKIVFIITFVVAIVLYFLPLNITWIGISDIHEVLIYFVIGMILHYLLQTEGIQQWFNNLKSGMLVLLMFAEILIYVFSYHYICSYRICKFFGGCLMIAFCMEFAEIIGEISFCKWISKNNFTIYIYFWPAQAAVMVLASKLEFNWLMTSVIMFIAGITVPVCMILIYKKLTPIQNKFFDLVLGVK